MGGWNFLGNGQIQGYADAGIETFNGNEIQSLAWETCQNSLDALREDQNTVIVESRYTIDTFDIPGYEFYIDVIKRCKEQQLEKSI